MLPKVKLITYTMHPIESVYHVWEASKNDGDVPTVAEIRDSPELRKKANSLFWEVIHQKIPVGEHVAFVFVLEGVSVSFREQMVRHRIGLKVGDNFGVDIVPDLASSSWWSQSMRIQDMGQFATKGMYRAPESLQAARSIHIGNGDSMTAESYFKMTMETIQRAYNELVRAGVPMEDAREVIPLGAQHRISWALNLQTLLHVLGKRGCWILQLGLWGPIIEGMVNALAETVDESFRGLLAPPCINSQDKFTDCLYPVENHRRIDERDAHPVCPLYVCRDSDAEQRLSRSASATPAGEEFYKLPLLKRPAALVELGLPRTRQMLLRAESYRKLWAHDPFLWNKEFSK